MGRVLAKSNLMRILISHCEIDLEMPWVVLPDEALAFIQGDMPLAPCLCALYPVH